MYTGTGAIVESGSDTNNSSDRSSYDLLADGTWDVVSGTGLNTITSAQDSSDISGGTYTYLVTGDSVSGGSVNGTWNESTVQHADTSQTVNWVLDSDDTWSSTGTWGDHNSLNTSSSYNGAGSYTVSTDMYTGAGAIVESGSDTNNSSDNSNYDLLADGTWEAVSGTGVNTITSAQDSSDISGGTYTYLVTGDSVSGGSVNGTWNESTVQHGDTSQTVNWRLGSDDTWSSTGTWGDHNSLDTSFSYDGAGSYTVSTDMYTGSGAIVEGGIDTNNSSDSSNYDLLADGTWQVVSGTGVNTITSAQGSSDISGGTYTYLVTGDSVSGGSVDGTWNESTVERGETTETVHWILDSADVWASTGTWAGDDSLNTTSSYNGAGSYTVNTVNPDGSWSNGTETIVESGSDSDASSASSSYILLVDGTWQAVSGSGSDSAGSAQDSSDTGNGSYGYLVSGGSVDGMWSHEDVEHADVSEATQWTLGSDGVWVGTGTWSQDNSSDVNDNYDGSGFYVIYYSGGASSTTGSGSISESGDDYAQSSDSSSYTLLADGTWQAASGSGSAASGNAQNWSDTASGAYGYVLAGGSVSGTWNGGATTEASLDETQTSTLGSDNLWITTGTRSETSAASANSAYSGQGTYTVNQGSANTWTTGTGTITESGSDTWSTGYQAEYNQLADGTWQVVAGSGAGAETGATDWSYTVSGNYGHPLDVSSTLKAGQNCAVDPARAPGQARAIGTFRRVTFPRWEREENASGRS